MTRHSLHNIAGIASRAGFTGKTIAEVVALAMHASLGDDAYDCLLNTEPLIHTRGMFAMDCARWMPEDRHALYDPHYSAQQLYADYRAGVQSLASHWASGVTLDKQKMHEIRTLLGTREATKPMEVPSKLSQMLYSHQHLLGS